MTATNMCSNVLFPLSFIQPPKTQTKKKKALFPSSSAFPFTYSPQNNHTKKEAYNTCCSQAVTHPSTGQAQRCLTSVIGREPVFSTWYGRRQQTKGFILLYRGRFLFHPSTYKANTCKTFFFTQHKMED